MDEGDGVDAWCGSAGGLVTKRERERERERKRERAPQRVREYLKRYEPLLP